MVCPIINHPKTIIFYDYRTQFSYFIACHDNDIVRLKIFLWKSTFFFLFRPPPPPRRKKNGEGPQEPPIRPALGRKRKLSSSSEEEESNLDYLDDVELENDIR